MKLTNRTARMDSSGLHNDRNFDVSKRPQIDPEKSYLNIYWCHDGSHVEEGNHFLDVEMKFYEDNFSDFLIERNEKYRKRSMPDQIKTMKQYYKAKNTRPEDQILQIGNMNDEPGPEVLWECALEYQKKFDKREKYNDICDAVYGLLDTISSSFLTSEEIEILRNKPLQEQIDLCRDVLSVTFSKDMQSGEDKYSTGAEYRDPQIARS